MPPILNQDIRERVRTTIYKRAPQNTTKQIKFLIFGKKKNYYKYNAIRVMNV